MNTNHPLSNQKSPLSTDITSETLSILKNISRILIAEDEPRIAGFIERGLQQSGFGTEIVSDGNAALDKVFKDTFDLLLLDLGLPEKDGREVLKELRFQGVNLPVILITAQNIDRRADAMINVFANDIVRKPFLMKDLLQKVRSLLPTP